MLKATDSGWQALHDECVTHLRSLIRLDTSNPPGNEILAAHYLRDRLADEGLDSEIVEAAPGRANLRAVLPGDGTHRPLLLMSHLDVVPVEPENWTHPPFGGDLVDGYVWGRGAVDMKQWVAWHLTIFLHLARTGARLNRDLVLLATADEEDGSVMGARWLAQNLPHWVDGEYALGEGGGGEMRIGDRHFFPCRVGEKGVCRLRLRARGTPGHASRPHRDNALVKLGAALERLGSIAPPVRPTDMVRGMLEMMLGGSEDGRLLIEQLLDDATFDTALDAAPFSTSMKLGLNAQMRNTATPTLLHSAGNRINVIPTTAEASLDGRILPGTMVESFVEEIQQVVGEDIEVEAYQSWPGSASRFDTELFKIMQDVTYEVAGAGLVPYLATGASDGHAVEPLGIHYYGYGPMRDEPEASPTQLMHAHDERISLANVDLGLRTLYEIVVRITRPAGK